MDYLDNPRKVYGRVDIIYSDSQISDDINSNTNSKAEISHPDEVFKGYLSPTVKACTMDGNSNMDSSFQKSRWKTIEFQTSIWIIYSATCPR